MKTAPLSSIVMRSVRWYERLLYLYPSPYRLEYGPWMAQLFRDQCKEAYEDTGWVGLIRTWLRVLPDLGVTVFQEHVAKLKPSKSMLKPNSGASIPVRSMAFVVTAAVAISAALVYYWPREHVCLATLELNSPGEYSQGQSELRNLESLAQTEMMRIQSQRFLMQVIRDFNLAGHYESSLGLERLSPEKACNVLRKHLQVRIIPNTILLQIRVRDRDPGKAANIANQIAARYIEATESQAQMYPRHIIKVLETRIAELDEQAGQMQRQITELQAMMNEFDAEAVQRIRGSMLDLQRMESETPFSQLASMPREQMRQVLPSIFPDTILIELLSNLNRAENELATLSKEYGSGAPQIQRISKLLEVINKQIEARIDGILAGFKTKADTIREAQKNSIASLEIAQEKARKNGEMALTLESKKRELQTLQDLRKTTQSQVFQAETDLQRRRPPATILEEARYPVESILPSFPKWLAWGILAAAGLYLAVILSLAIQPHRRSEAA